MNRLSALVITTVLLILSDGAWSQEPSYYPIISVRYGYHLGETSEDFLISIIIPKVSPGR